MSDLSQASIGIFDSGLGGLTIYQAIREQLPGESVIYLADSACAPYGEQQNAQIIHRAKTIVDWFLHKQVKILVIACNTATAAAIDTLRQNYTLPFIGIEPGIKPAIQHTQTRVIGVLATHSTLNSSRFQALLSPYQTDYQFICQAGYQLVEYIERQEIDSPVLYQLLQGYLTPMIQARADMLVLGCTHYPFLKPLIQQISNMDCIDTGQAVATHLKAVLTQHALPNCADHPAQTQFFTTGKPLLFKRFMHHFLHLNLPVYPIALPNPF